MTSNRTSNNAPQLSFAMALAMTMALGPLAIDTYLPAFPAMAVTLDSSIQQVSTSVAVYVFALAFGQLVAGPLSDRFGRASVMLSGLAIFAAASIMISQAPNLQSLLVGRMAQAFGGGWAMVGVPAIVRDRLSGNEAARFFSLIGLIMIVAPAIAPSLGSLILKHFEWGGIFVFLACYATAMMLLLWRVIFRYQQKRTAPTVTANIWKRYGEVLAVRPARRFLLLQAFSFSVMLLFITHASFIYQSHFDASPAEFALLFGANIVLMILFNLSNRVLLRRFPARQILVWGLSLQACGVLLLIVIASVFDNLWLFLPAMMLTVGALGAVTPNIQACYMDYFPQSSGTAAALFGAAQFSIAGSISALSTLIAETVLVIVLAQALCSLVCVFLLWRGRNESVPVAAEGRA